MKKALKAALCVALSLIVCCILPVFAIAANDDPMNGRFERNSKVSTQAFTESQYSHDARFATGYDIVDVIDVSTHNGDINWSAVYADGIRNVIIRVGYRGYTQGGIYDDDKFSANINGAIAAGLNVGVYFYTQAITISEAVEEADFVINKIKGYQLKLPVAYDCEYAESSGRYTGRLYEAKLSKLTQTEICLAFLNRIHNAGYSAMLYANPYMLNDCLYPALVTVSYPVWLAHYTTTPTYAGDYMIWQYSSKGSVSGISTKTDMSFWYVKKETPAVTYISISAPKTQLTVGEEVALTASTNPAALSAIGGIISEVSWQSSYPGVVTVGTDGKLRAISAGASEITAKVTVTMAPDSLGRSEVKEFTDKVIISVSNTAPVTPPADDPVTPPADDPITPVTPPVTPIEDPFANGFNLGALLDLIVNLLVKFITFITNLINGFNA